MARCVNGKITTDTEAGTTDEPSVSAEETQISITPGDGDTSLVIHLSDFQSTFFCSIVSL